MDSVHILLIFLALVSVSLYFLGLLAVLAGSKALYGKGRHIPMYKLAAWPVLIGTAVIEEVFSHVFGD